MSTASDRPQGARSTTPHSELPGSRNQTLTRVKSSEAAASAAPVDGDASELLGSAAEALAGSAPLDGATALESFEAPPPPLGSGVHADNLRKPYSSLAPQKRDPADPAAPTATPAPGRGSAGAARGSAAPVRSQTPTRRVSEPQDARRRATTCSKHGLARSRSGECMLCKKEQEAQKAAAAGLAWPVRIAIALGIGAAGFAGWLYLF